jgi:hypothetical protein
MNIVILANLHHVVHSLSAVITMDPLRALASLHILDLLQIVIQSVQ